MRERNVLLVAAGYAPLFPERSLNDPALSTSARRHRCWSSKVTSLIPAFAIDRHWKVVAIELARYRRSMRVSTRNLLQPARSTRMRLSLHPQGPRAANRESRPSGARIFCAQSAASSIELTADPALVELHGGTQDPIPRRPCTHSHDVQRRHRGPVPGCTFKARVSLSFFSTTMVFGTAGRHHAQRDCGRILFPRRCRDC